MSMINGVFCQGVTSSGETLRDLAEQCNCSVEQLQRVNPTLDPEGETAEGSTVYVPIDNTATAPQPEE